MKLVTVVAMPISSFEERCVRGVDEVGHPIGGASIGHLDLSTHVVDGLDSIQDNVHVLVVQPLEATRKVAKGCRKEVSWLIRKVFL